MGKKVKIFSKYLAVLLILSLVIVGGCTEVDPFVGNTYYENLSIINYLELNGIHYTSANISGVGVEVDPVFTASDSFGITAADIAGWDAHPPLTTGVHGVGAGDVVGTTLGQTLTNKTLTAPVINGVVTTTGLSLPAFSLLGDILTDRWLSYNRNTFLGVDVAGDDNLAHTIGSEGEGNTGIGYRALYNITTSYFNTAVGDSALLQLTDGVYNTAVGQLALGSVTTGQFNTAIGLQALHNNDGSYNTAIGLFAGGDNLAGSSNIFIGTSAGKSELGSHKLYIDVVDTATPLIWGDFATNHLVFNAVSVNITNGSLSMSQVAVEPSSTADRAGIYAWDLSADNATIGFYTEMQVIVADAEASTHKIPVRWNETTYYILVTDIP